jgi:uncharacterized low-complexity protein
MRFLICVAMFAGALALSNVGANEQVADFETRDFPEVTEVTEVSFVAGSVCGDGSCGPRVFSRVGNAAKSVRGWRPFQRLRSRRR